MPLPLLPLLLQGLFIDGKGHVQEGPNMNIGILTQDGTLITPPAESCLAGITMARLLELVPEVRRCRSTRATHAREHAPCGCACLHWSACCASTHLPACRTACTPARHSSELSKRRGPLE